MPDSRQLLDNLALAPLERHALLFSKEGRRAVFTAYLAMREKIAGDLLPLVASSEPFINDHSRHHLERVLAHIEAILRENFPNSKSQRGDIPEGGLITWADTVILLNALVWHDIGNVYSRKDHGQRVHDCFTTLSSRLYDTHLGDYVVQVASAHCGNGSITTFIPDSLASASYRNEDIHLQFLAAVLRFADELDEDHRRAAPNDWDALNVIPPANHKFWYFSKSNASVHVVTTVGRNALTHRVTVESHIPQTDFDRLFVSGSGTVRALTEYFCRILKLERERRYCNLFIRKAYYHPGIEGIDIHLKTHDNTDRPSAARSVSFSLSDATDQNDLVSTFAGSPCEPYVLEALALRGPNAKPI